jgi:hypothetical protein
VFDAGKGTAYYAERRAERKGTYYTANDPFPDRLIFPRLPPPHLPPVDEVGLLDSLRFQKVAHPLRIRCRERAALR